MSGELPTLNVQRPTANGEAVTGRTRFDELRQGEPWQCEVARDLNVLVRRAGEAHRSGDAFEEEFAAILLRLVGRVAEFEGIATREADPE